jgi:hypothetical protein
MLLVKIKDAAKQFRKKENKFINSKKIEIKKFVTRKASYVRFLLNHGLAFRTLVYDDTTLFKCLHDGDYEASKVLINKKIGIKYDDPNKNLLNEAIKNKYEDLAVQMIDLGCVVFYSAFKNAMENNMIKVVETIFKKYPTVDLNKVSTISLYKYCTSVEMMEIFHKRDYKKLCNYSGLTEVVKLYLIDKDPDLVISMILQEVEKNEELRPVMKEKLFNRITGIVL